MLYFLPSLYKLILKRSRFVWTRSKLIFTSKKHIIRIASQNVPCQTWKCKCIMWTQKNKYSLNELFFTFLRKNMKISWNKLYWWVFNGDKLLLFSLETTHDIYLKNAFYIQFCLYTLLMKWLSIVMFFVVRIINKYALKNYWSFKNYYSDSSKFKNFCVIRGYICIMLLCVRVCTSICFVIFSVVLLFCISNICLWIRKYLYFSLSFPMF